MNIDILLSPLLIVLGLFLLYRRNRSTLLQYFDSLFVILALLLGVTYLVSDFFTGVGIDDSVIYHLTFGLQGAGFGEYSKLILLTLVAITVALIATLFAWRMLRPDQINAGFARYYLGHLVFPLALVINPGAQDLFSLYVDRTAAGSNRSQDVFEQYYLLPEKIEKQGEGRDFIYIYLEGLENTFFDETLFPGLLPGLSRFKSRGLSFSKITQMPGTGWTIAGMTASQCGIPLVTSSDGNAMSGMDTFLSNAYCLGDFLSDQGYSLSYMGGASLTFGGKGSFYRSHGVGEVKGRDELAPKLSNKKYLSQWGLYDDSLFEFLFEEFVRLTHSQDSFGLFGLTLDTHHPKGHPSKSCASIRYSDGSNPMLNAVHCTDMLVSKFIDRVQSSGLADDVLIVIGSDHLALNGTSTDLLKRGDRKNLFLVIDPKGDKQRVIERSASMFDVSPTLLSLLGFDIERFGLGVNLLSNKLTLVEAEKKPDMTVKEMYPEFRAFWDLPNGRDGALINSKKSTIEVSGRSFTFPVLLEFNTALDVTDIRFEHNGNKKIISYFFEITKNSPILWIDACRKIGLLDSKLSTRGMCVFVGVPGAENHHAQSLRRQVEFFSAGRLERLFSTSSDFKKAIPNLKYDMDLDLPIDQIYRVEEKYGENEKGIVAIRSPGSMLGGDAYVIHMPSGVKFDMGSGLTVWGLSNKEVPENLLRIDPCNTVGANIAKGAVVRAIQASKSSFSGYALVVNDAGHCGDLEGEKLFLNLPLKSKVMEPGVPYIAVVEADLSEFVEYFGKIDDAIVVKIGVQ